MIGYIEDIMDRVVESLQFGSYDRQPSSVYKHLTPIHEGSSQSFVIVVNPAAVTDSKFTRCLWEKSVEIRVLVRDYIPVRGDANVTDGQSQEAEDMLTICQQIKEHLQDNLKIITSGSDKFFLDSISQDPLYDYASLLEDSTFISVISLTYKGFV